MQLSQFIYSMLLPCFMYNICTLPYIQRYHCQFWGCWHSRDCPACRKKKKKFKVNFLYIFDVKDTIRYLAFSIRYNIPIQYWYWYCIEYRHQSLMSFIINIFSFKYHAKSALVMKIPPEQSGPFLHSLSGCGWHLDFRLWARKALSKKN